MKVLWTLHDCWPFTGHCAYFTMAGCEKWRTHCEKCPQKSSYPASLVDNSYTNYERKRKIFTGVHDLTIITPSEWLASLVKMSFLREYPVEVRNNTIDTGIFRPTKNNFREKYNLMGKFIVLGVASLWEGRKGLHDFVKLSSLLDPEKFAVVLVGKMTPEQQKSLPENIITIPRTESRKDLAGIYTAADVFFCSSYEENYPTVNLEAEACGTPVITYDSGGCPETVKRDDSCVVRTGDVEAVRNIIIQKTTDPETRSAACVSE